MGIRVTHKKVVTQPDNPSKPVSTSEWNDDHNVVADAYKLEPEGYNLQSGSSYTLTNSDNGRSVVSTGSSSFTLTVPSGLAVGFSCLIVQAGTGQITVNAGVGASVNGFSGFNKTAGRYACALLLSPTVNNHILSGTISA